MKALSLAIMLATSTVAAPLVIAPAAYAQEEASEHGLKVGDRMPGIYTRSQRFEISDLAAHGLREPRPEHRWLLVDGTIYLVDRVTDRIVHFRPASAD
jgi:hypothetical protein